MYGRLLIARVILFWRMVICTYVSGLFMRLYLPLALMESADQLPNIPPAFAAATQTGFADLG